MSRVHKKPYSLYLLNSDHLNIISGWLPQIRKTSPRLIKDFYAMLITQSMFSSNKVINSLGVGRHRQQVGRLSKLLLCLQPTQSSLADIGNGYVSCHNNWGTENVAFEMYKVKI